MRSPDVSLIITAWKEPDTVRELIRSIEKQINNSKYEFEILLVCPDEETQIAANQVDDLKIIKWIKDLQKGKPAALNLAFEKAKGKFWILTDGDVDIKEGAIEKLLAKFSIQNVGAVSGYPLSLNSKLNILGYWSHLLTEMAHLQRLSLSAQSQFLFCSGYLMAVRSNLIKKIPEDILADDALISCLISNLGYNITYAPEAKVLVKFPTTFKDWIHQKLRSRGGYIQLSQFVDIPKSQRTILRSEILGIGQVLSYSSNAREFLWTILLLFARFYLWCRILVERKLFRKSFQKTWVRIESTK